MSAVKKPKWSKMDEVPSKIRHEYEGFKNLDAGESIFFARELEHVKAQTYDKKYPDLKARELFPVSFEAGEGAETITYEQHDQVGIAKIIANYADDLPRADVKGKEFTSRVKTLASSYGYNVQEIAASSKAGKPLTPRKANAAKRANMVLENKIAFFGDAECGIQGFLDNPNIQEVTLAADGAGSSKKFADKDADQIIRDVTDLFTAVHSISKGQEFANTLLLPIAQFNLLANLRIPATGQNVMSYLMEHNPFLKSGGSIVWVNEMEGSGAGGTDKMVAYRRDSDALSMEVPMDFKQLPVQERNLEFVVPTMQRFGGVLIYYPLSVAYSDDV